VLLGCAPPCHLPPAVAVAVVAAVAVDRFYHIPFDFIEHRRNEGRGLCFPSPWRRDTKSPTITIVSAAASTAAPAMTLATLAVAVEPLAAVPTEASHPAVAADADIAGTAPAHPPCRTHSSSPQKRSARCSTFACPPPQPSLLRGAAATVEVAWALVAPCVLPPHPAGLFPPLVERRHHQHRYLQGQLWRRCGEACGYCSSPLSSTPFIHFSATTTTETPPSAACLPRPISTCC